MKTNQILSAIQTQVNSLSHPQLKLLFHVYFHLNCQSNFFTTPHKHEQFINLFIETPSKNTFYTYQSLILLLTTSYTDPSRYPDLLYTIDMIKQNHSFDTIVQKLYPNR